MIRAYVPWFMNYATNIKWFVAKLSWHFNCPYTFEHTLSYTDNNQIRKCIAYILHMECSANLTLHVKSWYKSYLVSECNLVSIYTYIRIKTFNSLNKRNERLPKFLLIIILYWRLFYTSLFDSNSFVFFFRFCFKHSFKHYM